MRAAARQSLELDYSDPREVGAPVLFVHGFSHHQAVWEKLAESLPAGLRPILVDLRGHGASPWSPEGRYDLWSHVADLSALLDALAIARVAVVGHSLGGNVATLLAASEPHRVKELVLVDTGPALEVDGIAHIAKDFDSGLRSYASVAEFRRQLGAMHAAGDAELLDRLAARGLVERLDGRFEPALDPGVVGDGGVSTDLAGLEAELWSALAALRCPVLLVRGALSALLKPETARRMVDEVIEDARLVTLESAGHAVMIDAGPSLASEIQHFLGAAAG